jgi:hypothetical protein
MQWSSPNYRLFHQQTIAAPPITHGDTTIVSQTTVSWLATPNSTSGISWSRPTAVTIHHRNGQHTTHPIHDYTHLLTLLVVGGILVALFLPMLRRAYRSARQPQQAGHS